MDWADIISQLSQKGYTQEQIEEVTGIPQSSISAIKNGKQTSLLWEAGNALLELLEK